MKRWRPHSVKRRDEHCSAMAEVMLPNAELHGIACGKRRGGHGRWHENRRGVVWRGRWKAPQYLGPYWKSKVEAGVLKSTATGEES